MLGFIFFIYLYIFLAKCQSPRWAPFLTLSHDAIRCQRSLYQYFLKITDNHIFETENIVIDIVFRLDIVFSF